MKSNSYRVEWVVGIGAIIVLTAAAVFDKGSRINRDIVVAKVDSFIKVNNRLPKDLAETGLEVGHAFRYYTTDINYVIYYRLHRG